MMREWCVRIPGVLVLAALWGGTASAEDTKPVIQHEPVPSLVAGEPLRIKARITDDQTIIDAELYFSLSKDSLPTRIPMESITKDEYAGAIGAHLLEGSKQFYYYLRAMDNTSNNTETTTHTVQIQPLKPPAPPPPELVVVTPVVSAPDPVPEPVRPPVSSPDNKGGGISRPALWVGAGLAAAGGAAWALSDSGGNDEDSGDDFNDVAGTYQGSATICLQANNASGSCETTPMTIIVSSDGRIYSETLRYGFPGEDQLTADRTFRFEIEEVVSNAVSVIRYSGRIEGTRISGTIEGARTGSTTNDAGNSAVYSGYFSTTRR